MFLVYGDESLDETQSRVCAVGALVGTEESWQLLEEKWLALHGAIPFHANDCDSDHGDYKVKMDENADARHRANKDLYKASATLLVESEIGGCAVVYDLAAQRQHFPPPYDPPLYYQPFMDVLQLMRNFSDNRDDHVEFIFDSRIESEHNAGLIYAHLRESHPLWTERVASKISFESSRENRRIQMADLFAREAMKALDNEIGPVKRRIRKSWEALRSTGRFAVHSMSHDYFEAAKEDIPRVREVLGGLQQNQFAEWLKKRRKQWNVTNYFEFLTEYLNGLTPEERSRLNDQLSKRPF